ncbi:MAG: outer membrane protein assembly factor BamD [Proteobacteria bacterium]|nr:outer membrane protein assembly factor BamD [Pseudomonadota bacterium]
MKRLITLCLIGFLLSSGCSLWGKKKEKSAEELATDGIKSFDGRNYKDSIAEFTNLKNWYPFSKYAILADLKIADAHYHLKEYDEAIIAYSDFENLHPRNDAVPEVIYKTGLCYYDRIDTIDRDQSNTLKALNTFERIIRQFPDSEYAEKCRENINTCLETIAGHEMYVGKFYFKSEHYKAAKARFETVIFSYPKTHVYQEALQYLEKCKTALNQSQVPDN